MIALGSVTSSNLIPNKKFLKCSHDQTIASNSNTLVLYFFSCIFKNLETNDIGTQKPSGHSCSRDILDTFLLASHFTLLFLFWS